MMLTASMFTGCMMLTPTRSVTTVNYENPQWAPPYYSGARYYYLPDLELYYDLSSREFISLINGQWCYSPYVPAMYSNYDLNNCFCVVMNVNVYRPWLHHQYYVSHYPRYYYRDYYDHSNIPYVRAYNENSRKAIYWNENERSHARQWDDANLRDNRRFKYSKQDKEEQKTWNQTTTRPATTTQPRTTTRTETTTRPKTETPTRTEPVRTPVTRTTTTTRQSTNQETTPVRNNRTNYYGRTIGNSVRVTKEMKDNSATKSRATGR